MINLPNCQSEDCEKTIKVFIKEENLYVCDEWAYTLYPGYQHHEVLNPEKAQYALDLGKSKRKFRRFNLYF